MEECRDANWFQHTYIVLDLHANSLLNEQVVNRIVVH